MILACQFLNDSGFTFADDLYPTSTAVGIQYHRALTDGVLPVFDRSSIDLVPHLANKQALVEQNDTIVELVDLARFQEGESRGGAVVRARLPTWQWVVRDHNREFATFTMPCPA